MIPKPDLDAVVIGAGVAGVSLVSHLAASPWRYRRVLLLDRDEAPLTGRAWSFWAAGPRLADAAVSRSWATAAIYAAGGYHRVALDPYRYSFVRGSDLMQVHRHLLRQAPRFERRTTTVRSVASGSATQPAVVRTDAGEVTARWVFDSRRPDSGPAATMVFRGHEIAFDRPLPDQGTVTFLDFRVPRSDALTFAYLLPIAPHRAIVDLVELVGPSERDRHPSGTGGEPARESLDRYLREVRGLSDWSVMRTEQDALPLRPTATRPRRSSRILAIGRAAGLLRASTGFAFDRIQRDSVRITESLVNHDDPGTGWRPPRRHAWLDAVFLQVALHEPEHVETAMARLFRQPSAALPLAFLDGDTSLEQEAQLIRHLPYRPFLRGALATRR